MAVEQQPVRQLIWHDVCDVCDDVYGVGAVQCNECIQTDDAAEMSARM
jgi:hypothetical protein